MKKIMIMIIVSMFCFCSEIRSQISTLDEYYYYNGKKVFLPINRHKLFVSGDQVDKIDLGIPKKKAIKSKPSENDTLTNKRIKNNTAITIEITDSADYAKVWKRLKQSKYVHKVEKAIEDKPIPLSVYFYVKLKEEKDTNLLKEVASKTQCTVLRKAAHTKNWYALLPKNDSKYNTLEASNLFFESGFFSDIDPGFVIEFKHTCVTDTRFSDQWGMGSSSSFGINACQAWNITKGNSSVIVAVYDSGVDENNREFAGTNFTTSYSTSNRSSPAGIREPHGTRVASIISANHNRSKVAGVAPDVSIMNISHGQTATYSEDLAAGFNWAVQNGAAIINCSWGVPSQNSFSIKSTMLEDAITNALFNGRNGLGAIVIFGTGNDAEYFSYNYGTIHYPANYRDEILTVGATGNNGNRGLFSAFGAKLDVMAPGFNILSADLNNDVSYDFGTSYAAPHVSGVAALMLSVSPHLTRETVVKIIESTCRKVGTVLPYSTEANRPNGTRNQQMGYGLIDAFAAVQAAQNCQSDFVTNTNYNSNTTINTCEISFKNVKVQNGAKLIVNKTNHAIMNDFEVILGSELDIR